MDWLKSIAQAIALAIAGLFLRVFGKQAEEKGALKERERQHEAKDQIREKWDDIDRRPVDYDSAIDRLRDRSKGQTPGGGDSGSSTSTPDSSSRR